MRWHPFLSNKHLHILPIFMFHIAKKKQLEEKNFTSAHTKRQG